MFHAKLSPITTEINRGISHCRIWPCDFCSSNSIQAVMLGHRFFKLCFNFKLNRPELYIQDKWFVSLAQEGVTVRAGSKFPAY